MSSPDPAANGVPVRRRQAPTDDPRDPQTLGMSAIRPVEYHGWTAFSRFCYNPDNGAICSRTPKSWFLVLLYYACFLLCLFGFWFALMQIFFTTLNESQPKYIGKASLIGLNPGLGIRPREAESRLASGLIRLDKHWNGTRTQNKEEFSNAGYAARLEEFYESLEFTKDAANGLFEACNESELHVPREAHQLPCTRDLSFLEECGEFPYGYAGEYPEPCLIIKINKIFAFTPEPLNSFDVEKMNETELPPAIKKEILKPGAPDRIYINCDGVKAADQEALKGVIKYFPSHQGVPMSDFPHRKLYGVSPMIGVKFVGLPRGQTVHTECKVYFRNVVHDSTTKSGLVKFDIHIDA